VFEFPHSLVNEVGRWVGGPPPALQPVRTGSAMERFPIHARHGNSASPARTDARPTTECWRDSMSRLDPADLLGDLDRARVGLVLPTEVVSLVERAAAYEQRPLPLRDDSPGDAPWRRGMRGSRAEWRTCEEQGERAHHNERHGRWSIRRWPPERRPTRSPAQRGHASGRRRWLLDGRVDREGETLRKRSRSDAGTDQFRTGRLNAETSISTRPA